MEIPSMDILIATSTLRLGNIKQGDCTPLTPKKIFATFFKKYGIIVLKRYLFII